MAQLTERSSRRIGPGLRQDCAIVFAAETKRWADSETEVKV